jgi:hypothetical protein
MGLYEQTFKPCANANKARHSSDALAAQAVGEGVAFSRKAHAMSTTLK